MPDQSLLLWGTLHTCNHNFLCPSRNKDYQVHHHHTGLQLCWCQYIALGTCEPNLHRECSVANRTVLMIDLGDGSWFPLLAFLFSLSGALSLKKSSTLIDLAAPCWPWASLSRDSWSVLKLFSFGFHESVSRLGTLHTVYFLADVCLAFWWCGQPTWAEMAWAWCRCLACLLGWAPQCLECCSAFWSFVDSASSSCGNSWASLHVFGRLSQSNKVVFYLRLLCGHSVLSGGLHLYIPRLVHEVCQRSHLLY